MKVHLVRKKTIQAFWEKNVQSKIPLEEWLVALGTADWKGPADIKNTFNSSDLLGRSSSRVVFNIGGNNYRMICKYVFGEKQVHLFICWMGTHAEYDKLNKWRQQYKINMY